MSSLPLVLVSRRASRSPRASERGSALLDRADREALEGDVFAAVDLLEHQLRLTARRVVRHPRAGDEPASAVTLNFFRDERLHRLTGLVEHDPLERDVIVLANPE